VPHAFEEEEEEEEEEKEGWCERARGEAGKPRLEPAATRACCLYEGSLSVGAFDYGARRAKASAAESQKHEEEEILVCAESEAETRSRCGPVDCKAASDTAATRHVAAASRCDCSKAACDAAAAARRCIIVCNEEEGEEEEENEDREDGGRRR
tara:strand:- start:221 stop:679 length:459 start_codon:yes stop_codon:yes gene_type:complete